MDIFVMRGWDLAAVAIINNNYGSMRTCVYKFGRVLMFEYDILKSTGTTYYISLWAASGKLFKNQTRGPDAPVRHAGQHKATRGSSRPDQRVGRFLRVIT